MLVSWASQLVLVVKNLSADAWYIGDAGWIPGSGRCPGGGHDNPLQYSCLENSMDRGVWWATVHGVAKIWTWLKWLSMHTLKQHKQNLFWGQFCWSFYLMRAWLGMYNHRDGNWDNSHFTCTKITSSQRLKEMQTLHMGLTHMHGWQASQWIFTAFALTPEKWQRLPSRSEAGLKEGSLATIKQFKELPQITWPES